MCVIASLYMSQYSVQTAIYGTNNYSLVIMSFNDPGMAAVDSCLGPVPVQNRHCWDQTDFTGHVKAAISHG